MSKIKFIQDVFVLQIGNFSVAGISFVSNIVLARLLKPEKLGLYAIIVSLFGLVMTFGNLSMGPAAVTRLSAAYARRDKKEITFILGQFLSLSFLIRIVILIVSFWLLPYLAVRFYRDNPAHFLIGNYARVLVLSPLFAVGLTFFSVALQSSRKIKQLTLLENGQEFIKLVIIFIVLLLGLQVKGVIYGTVGSSFLVGVFAFLSYVWLMEKVHFPSIREIIQSIPRLNFKRQFDFIKFSFTIALSKNLVDLYRIVPMLILGRLPDLSQAGQLRVAISLIYLPLLIFNAISRNLAVKLAENKGKNDIAAMKKNFWKVTGYAGIISIVVVVLFIFFLPLLLRIYGKDYQLALPLLYILAVLPVLAGFSVGLGPLYRTLERMGIQAKIHLAVIVVLAFPVFLLVSKLGAAGAAFAIITLFTVDIILSLFFAVRLLAQRI